jgi:hypothetical protein
MCYWEERSDEAISNQKEIAAPFGLAMTVIIFTSVALATNNEQPATRNQQPLLFRIVVLVVDFKQLF